MVSPKDFLRFLFLLSPPATTRLMFQPRFYHPHRFRQSGLRLQAQRQRQTSQPIYTISLSHTRRHRLRHFEKTIRRDQRHAHRILAGPPGTQYRRQRDRSSQARRKVSALGKIPSWYRIKVDLNATSSGWISAQYADKFE